MTDLYPTFDVPSIEEEFKNSDEGYKISAYFDFEKGDFVVDETGQIKEATGSEAFINWCIKTVHTSRYSCFLYSENYGVETEEVFDEPSRNAQESMLEHTIIEALLSDPYSRTIDVFDFSFNWVADSVTILFTVLGIENVEEQITVSLGGA